MNAQNTSCDHSSFERAEALTRAWLRPATDHPSAFTQLTVSPDGRRAVAAALVCEALEGLPSTRIALIDLRSGDVDILTKGPRSDSAPKWSPDGRFIAFLSDREQAHINRLRIFDLQSRTERATPAVDGFVEYIEWSSDGKTLLLGVAGYGSDLAGAQGALVVNLDAEAGERPAWAPTIEGVRETAPWRSTWLYDAATDAVRPLTVSGLNIWQAVWCGPKHIAVICSNQPEEAHWYSAEVRLIDVDTRIVRSLFQPEDQLGWIAASPSGRSLAVVEAVCSDRNLAAGDVRLIDVERGDVGRAATLGADVVQMYWRDEDQLLFVGAQGPATIIGLLDHRSGSSREIWRSEQRTPSGMIFPEIAPLGRNAADVLFQCESFFEPPALIALEAGREREIHRFGADDAAVGKLGSARDFSWRAPDGLKIHGWLIAPSTPGPHPLIMQVHGGPVWYLRPAYIGRSALQQMALEAGYALFLPNPRGSSGRGQAFARHVFGDMGGKDTQDYLSGLDCLVEAGIVDPARIGVMGTSYGGFMTDWLITQDDRFAAAVGTAPVSNWVSMHLTCNVDTFCEMFLNDRLSNPTGKYFMRSPIHHAHRVKTPTLNVCGARDKITPPGQAVEFHNALQSAGVESVLLTYPQEGHGVRSMPAIFDFTARVLAWFTKHMPPGSAPRPLSDTVTVLRDPVHF